MKAFITVIGNDQVGIIARIATILSESKINILDINQTVMDGKFTMIMLADISESSIPFNSLSEILANEGKSLGLSIQIQHEDIFNSMHRI